MGCAAFCQNGHAAYDISLDAVDQKFHGLQGLAGADDIIYYEDSAAGDLIGFSLSDAKCLNVICGN